MNKIIITTHEELSEMIESSLSRRINPLRDIINQKLNPQKTNLTVQEAAKRLNVTELTIRNYIQKGLIDATKIGRRIVINVESLESKLTEVKSLKYRR